MSAIKQKNCFVISGSCQNLQSNKDEWTSSKCRNSIMFVTLRSFYSSLFIWHHSVRVLFLSHRSVVAFHWVSSSNGWFADEKWKAREGNKKSFMKAQLIMTIVSSVTLMYSPVSMLRCKELQMATAVWWPTEIYVKSNALQFWPTELFFLMKTSRKKEANK